jgi:uncharacterized membrane protein YvbJ
MPDTSSPKCAVCGAPSKWFCAFCGSNCYCDEHACNHIARQYPEEFGIKPRPEQREQQEREKTAKGYWMLLAIIAIIVILFLIWGHPGDGSYLN